MGVGQLIALSICASVASGVSRVELHVHLDGATSFETLYDIAVHRNLTLPTGVNSKASLQAYCGTFATTGFGFFDCVLDFLGGDLWSIALAAERFVAFQASNNVSYTEVRYAPQTLAASPKYGNTITPAQAVDAVTSGLQKGLATHPQLQVYQILCVDRHLGASSCLPVVKLAHTKARSLQRGSVVGIDLAGNESAFPNDPFVACFQHAHMLGVNATIHAGEMPDTTAESVYQAVVEMHAKRIGHGYAAAANASVVQLLKERNVFIEACPSTCLEEYSAAHKDCPIAKFLEAGLKNFGINTDDPTLWGTSLPNEESKAKHKLGLPMEIIEDGYARAYAARFS